MFHSPNERFIEKEKSSFDPYHVGENYIYTTGFNQIGKWFKTEIDTIKKELKKEEDALTEQNEAYDVLLYAGYYEGSVFGRFSKGGDSKSPSKTYVSQPDIEKRLQDMFIGPKTDMVKFLVGYTGIGKTTLLRNVFRVYDRNTTVFQDNLIIYISFFSMAKNDYGDEKKAIEKVVVGAIENASTLVGGFKNHRDRTKTYNKEYYQELYDFINKNNPSLISELGSAPDLVDLINKYNNKYGDYHGDLIVLSKEQPVDYALSQLKYYLKKHSENAYKNVIVIFDDIEKQSETKQREIIKLAYDLQKCMQANGDDSYYRSYSFKVLISLRNYVFRNYKFKETYREIDLNDIIVKDSAPSLKDILKLRFNQVKKIDNNKKYEKAHKELNAILDVIDKKYDSVLLNLTHYNIFACMKILLRILTNKQFIGENEINNKGAFIIDSKRYAINTKPVFFAMAFGEKSYYIDIGNYYLTNIMHYRQSDKVNNELLGLYIIKYMIRKNYYLKVLCFKSEMNINTSVIIDRIANCFSNITFEQEFILRKALNATIKYLYEGGALLESLYNPSGSSSTQNYEREYHNDMDVYLSLRGKQLYELLSVDSLLLEVYRDDIDTEIEGNTRLSTAMSTHDRFIYCIRYVEHLFDVEKRLLEKVSDWDLYIDYFSDTLSVITLLHGLKKGYKKYFSEATDESLDLMILFNSLCRMINNYIEHIQDTYLVNLNKAIELRGEDC